jgi:hypothetical protein
MRTYTDLLEAFEAYLFLRNYRPATHRSYFPSLWSISTWWRTPTTSSGMYFMAAAHLKLLHVLSGVHSTLLLQGALGLLCPHVPPMRDFSCFLRFMSLRKKKMAPYRTTFRIKHYFVIVLAR